MTPMQTEMLARVMRSERMEQTSVRTPARNRPRRTRRPAARSF
jgi:hypothetical protein